MAIWHRPRFSSGPHGSSMRMEPLWKLLYRRGAELVVSGHDHDYERFAMMNGAGQADPMGMRQFVVGTGGAPLYASGSPLPASEVRNSDSHGVLRLTLHASSYEWQFMPIAGDSFTDAGSDSCH
jgi:hypothetical protein